MKAAKAWYFAYFASLSCLFPFLNLFFRRLGLGERAIGVLGAARPLISLPAGSLWSGAADKSRRHRAVLLGCYAASAAARLAIAPVGAHWGSTTYVPLLAVVLLTEAFAAPVTIIVDSAVMAACGEQGDYGRQRLFGALGWGLFSAVAGFLITHAGIYAAFWGHAALVSLALGPTLRLPFGPLHAKLYQQADGGRDDGQGSDAAEGDCEGSGSGLGWERECGAGSGSGCAQQEAAAGESGPEAWEVRGGRGVQRFDSALEASSLLERGAGSSRSASLGGEEPTGSGGMGKLPKTQPLQPPPQQQAQQQQRQQQQRQNQRQQPSVRYWAGVAQLLRRPEAAIFLVMAVIMGVGVGHIEGFLFLYIDELGGSELLMGLSLSVTCAAESLVFFFLPQLLRMGIRRCMHLVLLAFLVRMGCYAALQYAPTPWLVLPVEVLHGFTFALAWGGGCTYCQELAPPGLESTTQGLFQGLYFGLGVAAGSAIGGTVYQRHGAQAVYLVACAVLAAGWLVCSLAQLAVHLVLGPESGRAKYLQVAAADVEMSQGMQGKLAAQDQTN